MNRLSIPKLFQVGCMAAGALLLAGCLHSKPKPSNEVAAAVQVNTDPGDRFVFPGESPDGTSGPPSPADSTIEAQIPPPLPITIPLKAPVLQAGEKIEVTFYDLPPPLPPPHEQRIRDDGTITLPFGKNLVAAGKTPGQLEDEIRKAYVPNLYKHLTPIVKADERTFAVTGEVKNPNRQLYSDRITVLRAIAAAGDFSDYANRKNIQVTRGDGTKVIVDWYKAKENPKLDPQVFPGDVIIVNKRW